MSDRLEEILFKLRTFREVEHNDNQWSTEFVYSLDEAKQALQSYIDSKIIEELERILDGQGRKTGIWHYELNDANEMEASYMGEYVKISELQTRLSELKALNHRKENGGV